MWKRITSAASEHCDRVPTNIPYCCEAQHFIWCSILYASWWMDDDWSWSAYIFTWSACSSESPSPGMVRSADIIEIRAMMLSSCLCRCANSAPLSNALNLVSGERRQPCRSEDDLMIRYTYRRHNQFSWDITSLRLSHICLLLCPKLDCAWLQSDIALYAWPGVHQFQWACECDYLSPSSLLDSCGRVTLRPICRHILQAQRRLAFAHQHSSDCNYHEVSSFSALSPVDPVSSTVALENPSTTENAERSTFAFIDRAGLFPVKTQIWVQHYLLAR